MISIEKKFVFIHRGKSGGNSLTKLLLPYCEEDRIITTNEYQDGINYFDVKNLSYGTRKHSGLLEYKEAFLKKGERIDDFYKFSIVRNPFERLISAYFSPVRVAKKQITSFVKKDFLRLVSQQRTLRDFICTQKDGDLLSEINDIIIFENFQNDVDKIFDRLNMQVRTLPYKNKSNRQDYRSYYDDEIIEAVTVRFQEEISYFNYSF